MTPKKFKESNIVFAENQEEYEPLPAFKNNSVEGEVITCWNLTLRERFKLLFTGELWLMLLTFNQPLTPTYLTVNKSDILTDGN